MIWVIFFMSGQNKFLARDGEGRAGHNGENKFIDVFHISDHLEQFGRLLFFQKNCGKMNNLDGWGYPRGKFRLYN